MFLLQIGDKFGLLLHFLLQNHGLVFNKEKVNFLVNSIYKTVQLGLSIIEKNNYSIKLFFVN